MPVYAEANNLGDVLKYEAPNLYSREAVTVLAGTGADRTLTVGTVIGKRTKDTVTVTADPATPATARRPWPTRRSVRKRRSAPIGSFASPPPRAAAPLRC